LESNQAVFHPVAATRVCSAIAKPLSFSGSWPSRDVDHVDGEPGNDAFENLRPMPHADNERKSCAGKRPSQMFIGAVLHKKCRGTCKRVLPVDCFPKRKPVTQPLVRKS
jgi:hypothetical protein